MRSYQPARSSTQPASPNLNNASNSAPSGSSVRAASCSREAGCHADRVEHDTIVARDLHAEIVQVALQRSGQAEPDEHVGHLTRSLRPVAQQPVRARRCGAADRPWNREDRPRPPLRLVHRVHRAAEFTRLDDDHDVRQRRDESIARREPPSLGRRTQRRFAEHHTAAFDLTPQDGVPLRIDDIETAAHDRDRCGGAGRQRAGVSRTVDADRQPRDDRDPG